MIVFDGLGLTPALIALVVAGLVSLLAVLLRPLYKRTSIAFGEAWREALRGRRRSWPWREIVAWVVFGVALAALSLGVAGPRLARERPRRIAMLFDTSASMAAIDDEGVRRIDRARLAAAELLDARRPGDEVRLYAVGESVRPMEAWELATVEPEDGGADFEAAVAVAGTFLTLDDSAEGHLVVFSDVAPPQVEGISVEPVLFGGDASNLAVTALGVSAAAEGEGGLDVLVTVVNHSDHAARGRLVVHTPEFRLAEGPLELAAGASSTHTFHVERLPGSEVWASIVEPTFVGGGVDALAVDNRRVTWASADGFLDVVLVSDGNRFLEGVLQVLGGVSVRTVAPGSRIEDADVVILDRARAAIGPEVAGVLEIGLATGRAVEAPELLDWNPDHPATRRVSLDNLTLASAHLLDTKDAVVLAGVREGAIAVAREQGGRREIELGFDLTQSDFPLRFAFPIFVGSALRWLANERSDTPYMGVAGRPVSLREDAREVISMTTAPGQVVTSESPLLQASARLRERSGTPELTARRAGLYQVGSARVVVGVDPQESQITGAYAPVLPSRLLAPAPPEAWPWTALCFAFGAGLLTTRLWLT